MLPYQQAHKTSFARAWDRSGPEVSVLSVGGTSLARHLRCPDLQQRGSPALADPQALNKGVVRHAGSLGKQPHPQEV
eukprot:14971317-Alexandrium_andersonii.AAC.1